MLQMRQIPKLKPLTEFSCCTVGWPEQVVGWLPDPPHLFDAVLVMHEKFEYSYTFI